MSSPSSSSNTTPRLTPSGLPATAPSAAPLSVTPKSSSAPADGKGPHAAAAAATGGAGAGGVDTDKAAASGSGASPLAGAGQAVSSPAELMTFVDTMLAQLEDKFNESSTEVLERMTTMSTRIDSLEMAISDIINGEILPATNGTAA